MTAEQFDHLMERYRATVGSERALAKRLRVAHGLLPSMRYGTISVDPAIAAYVRALIAAVESVPMPELPDRRKAEGT